MSNTSDPGKHAGGSVRGRLRLPSFGHVALTLSLLALVSLCYLAGAATMFYGLPPSEFLVKSFVGLQDSKRQDAAPSSTNSANGTVVEDQSEATYNGYTLITKDGVLGAELLDMRGEVVHHWEMAGHRLWARAEHVREPLPTEKVMWTRCHLFPNGDVLGLCVASEARPNGYGIVKLDKDSRYLWGFSANVHHDLDVGDDGRIYTLTQDLKAAPADSPFGDGEFSDESLLILSPEGKELDSFSIYDAFRNSPYSLLLRVSAEAQAGGGAMPPPAPPVIGGPPHPAGLPAHPMPPPPPPPPPGQSNPGLADTVLQADFLHTNSVKVLSARLAPKFPMFKAGMVLISMRTSSLIAVLDVKTRSVVWATKGPWRYQHDAHFLDNGRILLLDNSGSSASSRVLEFDPATQAVTWCSSGDNGPTLFVPFEGQCQRLPNGNTLITIPNNGILEMTNRKQIVWQWGRKQSPFGGNHGNQINSVAMISATRYSTEELAFLNGSASPRSK